MRALRMIGLLLVMVAATSGCSKLAGAGKKGGAATPGDAVHTFLTAICSADEPAMFGMLTDDACKALKSHNMSPQLPSSGSTSFEIGEVEMVDGGAHVMTKWFDRLEDGTRDTTEVLWMLRQEQGGWRVAGMAMRVYDDQPAAILNFEDPDDMTARSRPDRSGGRAAVAGGCGSCRPHARRERDALDCAGWTVARSGSVRANFAWSFVVRSRFV